MNAPSSLRILNRSRTSTESNLRLSRLNGSFQGFYASPVSTGVSCCPVRVENATLSQGKDWASSRHRYERSRSRYCCVRGKGRALRPRDVSLRVFGRARIVVEAVPYISHRRMEVVDVPRSGGSRGSSLAAYPIMGYSWPLRIRESPHEPACREHMDRSVEVLSEPERPLGRDRKGSTSRVDRRSFLKAAMLAAGSAFGCSLLGCDSEFDIPCLGPAPPPVPVPGMTYIRASEIGCALDCDLRNGRNKYTGGAATDDGPRINAAMAGATRGQSDHTDHRWKRADLGPVPSGRRVLEHRGTGLRHGIFRKDGHQQRRHPQWTSAMRLCRPIPDRQLPREE